MGLVLDHMFFCTAPGAPEAARLIAAGLTEGPPNTHPGQGTANRRFFFPNFMLELLWVNNPEEAQNAATRDTRLWERWSQRETVCPFGFAFTWDDPPPFESWSYRPSFFPPGLSAEIATGTPLDEPMLFGFRTPDRGSRGHGQNRFAPLKAVELTTPVHTPSSALAKLAAGGMFTLVHGNRHRLILDLTSLIIDLPFRIS